MLTAARLREVLHYDPATGLWRWLVTLSNRAIAGNVAGSLRNDGYWRIRVDGRLYGAHRLAVLYMTGEWPEADVDHEDRNRANNRWLNIRPGTRSQNLANVRVKAISSTGVKGVRPNPCSKTKPFRAGIQGRHIGCFATAEEAGAAYFAEAQKIYGSFARA